MSYITLQNRTCEPLRRDAKKWWWLNKHVLYEVVWAHLNLDTQMFNFAKVDRMYESRVPNPSIFWLGRKLVTSSPCLVTNSRSQWLYVTMSWEVDAYTLSDFMDVSRTETTLNLLYKVDGDTWFLFPTSSLLRGYKYLVHYQVLIRLSYGSCQLCQLFSHSPERLSYIEYTVQSFWRHAFLLSVLGATPRHIPVAFVTLSM